MAFESICRCFAVALVGLLGAAACHDPERAPATEMIPELAQAEARMDALETGVDAVAGSVERMDARTASLVSKLSDAAVAYQRARDELERSAALGVEAGERYQRAQDAFASAQSAYRIAAYSIIALTLTTAAAKQLCATRMSTSQYRAKHGITDPDVHVDHVLPRARGGLDHPLNYQPLDAHTNMSCGDGCLVGKLATEPLAFATGVAVSVLGRLGCP